MTKFKVGDRVRHAQRGVGTIVAKDGWTVKVVYDNRGGPWVESPGSLSLVPSVPDVDGNPIVVGQLVEYANGGDPCWVTEVCPDGVGVYRYPCVRVRDGVGVYKAGDFRIVTETVRPPQPATRDVVLRVVITCDGSDDVRAFFLRALVSDVVRVAVAEKSRWNLRSTVEVVE